ncbi:carboxypeptidase-like regulatory domain-containing protein [Geobacter sp. DSM 9736]|uniref:carboxypeptidase-like regulatory domain-containing protein n=1 Tax=Geobacter sp. DSM 9736 TaxID=1277350 RepID=UPI000B51274C|nr:carboxypeptidase-like regulatory domain-containing protein [Geobacter sp. DSM 9736]SNB46788.1 hypothetical protein SAMN06269301_2258 [Geobacter sp. DSM 9736]
MKRISSAVLAVAVMLTAGLTLAAGEAATGTLSGKMMISTTTPMSEGMVYIYNLANGPAPSHERYWRVPDFVERLDKEGRFSLDLPAGEYCVGAIKRHGSTQIGPPQEGDHFLIGLDDKKIPKKYRLSKGEKLDLGVMAGALPFRALPVKQGVTAVEGTVQDPSGKPVEGVFIFAFVTPTVIGKPLFVSDRSDKDGKFLLRVHEGGTYFLKVRDSYGGGPPRGGSVLDGNKEGPMQKVSLKTGEVVRGVTLKGLKFPGRGPNKE